MLVWTMSGYLYEQQKSGQPFDLREGIARFGKWAAYLRRVAYKDEFQR